MQEIMQGGVFVPILKKPNKFHISTNSNKI